MFDLDLGIRADNLYLVVSLFHMGGEIRKQELPV
jgi:hypothetical protein